MNILNQFTWRTLCKNKTRTLVTIVGILLSVSMFTAVTSIVVSFQQYLVNQEIASTGKWEGRLNNVDEESIEKLLKEKEITGYMRVANIGYAELDNSQNPDKPYLFVAGLQKNFAEYSPVNVLEGRMPENSTEIIISDHVKNNGGVSYEIGEKLTLQVGKRIYEDGMNQEEEIGGQDMPYIRPSKEGKEVLVDCQEKSYTVVGICERSGLEPYSGPGYTIYTVDDDLKGFSYDILLTFANPQNSEKIMSKYAPENASYTVHSDLLRYQGKSLDRAFNAVLYGMAAILMGIIMFGSISLIYNAFSISINERTKQFGLLKSIGATKKQMKKSVLFEACVLSLAGIPLGILAGLGGIGVTLHYIGKLLQVMLVFPSEVSLELVVSLPALAIAAVIGFITVIISAMIPARRAVKVSPIQAIRQNKNIRIKTREVRTSKLSYRLFGFEAMLAGKNFKRNRRKYRATVISLFLSVVLFVTANCFSGYLQKSVQAIEGKSNYDINFTIKENERKQNTAESTWKDVNELSSVDTVAYAGQTPGSIRQSKKDVNEDYWKFIQENMPEFIDEENGTMDMAMYVCFIQDDYYREYLQKNHLDASRYMNVEEPTALVWDMVNISGLNQRVYTFHMLKKSGMEQTLRFYQEREGYQFSGASSLDNKAYYRPEQTKDGIYDEMEVPEEEAVFESKMTLGEIQDGQMPLGALDTTWANGLLLVLPYSAKDTLAMKPAGFSDTCYHILAENHNKATEEISSYLSEGGYESTVIASMYDAAQNQDASEAMILVVNIFSYGFIILISLIALANVFNTISTNILLRRQEFAMLKSVGMTRKGFDRMMNYECLLYGIKGLLYGIPVSLLLSWLMYRNMSVGWNAEYFFPWEGILVATVSVFVVVFATMMYSMSKIKKDNPIDALRNENL